MTIVEVLLFVMVVSLAIAAVAGAAYFRIKRRNEVFTSYVKAVEDERNAYRREMTDVALQNQILVAKLEQIDKVLTKLGADSIRVRIQPFLLSSEAKNDARQVRRR